jgi:Flp pilus assembly protein TadB
MRVAGALTSLSTIAMMLNAQLGGPFWVTAVTFAFGAVGLVFLWGSMRRWKKLELFQDRVEDALRKSVPTEVRR